MATDWFIEKGEKWHGPFSSSQLKQLAEMGDLEPERKIRKGRDGNPIAVKNVKGLLVTESDLSATTDQHNPAPPEPKTAVNRRQEKAGETTDISKSQESWFFKKRGKNDEHGPFSFVKLNAIAAEGDIVPDDQIAPQGGKWIPVGSFLKSCTDSIPPDISDDGVWYAEYGNRKPKTFGKLCELALSGNLSPKVLIGKKGTKQIAASAVLPRFENRDFEARTLRTGDKGVDVCSYCGYHGVIPITREETPWYATEYVAVPIILMTWALVPIMFMLVFILGFVGIALGVVVPFGLVMFNLAVTKKYVTCPNCHSTLTKQADEAVKTGCRASIGCLTLLAILTTFSIFGALLL